MYHADGFQKKKKKTQRYDHIDSISPRTNEGLNLFHFCNSSLAVSAYASLNLGVGFIVITLFLCYPWSQSSVFAHVPFFPSLLHIESPLLLYDLRIFIN